MKPIGSESAIATQHKRQRQLSPETREKIKVLVKDLLLSLSLQEAGCAGNSNFAADGTFTDEDKATSYSFSQPGCEGRKTGQFNAKGKNNEPCGRKDRSRKCKDA